MGELQTRPKNHRRQHADDEPDPVKVHVDDLLLALIEVVCHGHVDARLVAAIPFAEKREEAVFEAEKPVRVVGEGLEPNERIYQLLLQVVVGEGSSVQQRTAGKGAARDGEQVPTRKAWENTSKWHADL